MYKRQIVDAAAIANDLGNPRVMNGVLLGTIIKAMGLTQIDWERIITQIVKPAFVDINIEAIKAGMNAVN